MDRREFSALLPAVLAATALSPQSAAAQQGNQQGTMDHPVMGKPTLAPPTGPGPLPTLVSGVYLPGPSHETQPKRFGRPYLAGILSAGNIQLELHQTTQEVGALHEADGTHLHNELWFVKEGVCELTINGVTRRMAAGDCGLVCAGDHHYIRNAGHTPTTYFVIALGPPEQRI